MTTTVSEYAADILALAGEADDLVGQFQTLMANIEAKERALHLQAINSGAPVQDAVAGRRRLGLYAHELIINPAGKPSVTELATKAWSEFL